ncbi:hypothetical protein HN385_01705 [archaeon]|jgi:hypothetical protein|nr:hypothetical protein [archaeon]MBT3451545.1 hypothetical protein [archaeon]MBT6869404.1 hypothetical protein [archaeon]MBT7192567.1 hypothetical protein [archaeon]MBT7380643.1 hypothetical protein [archaeon]
MVESDSIISGIDLVQLMDVEVSTYDSIKIPKYAEHAFLYPRNLFVDSYEITNFPERVMKVIEGEYKTGEIWKDTYYDVIYLYVGKFNEEKDVVINLGGDTGRMGCLEQGVINSGDEGRIFFDKKLFP